MVNRGAIDEDMFNDSNGEIVFVYSKIAAFIPQLRETFGLPEMLQNMEKLVKRIPNIDEKIAQMLKEEGISVTRRSITKYREDLRIPSTHQRRVRP